MPLPFGLQTWTDYLSKWGLLVGECNSVRTVFFVTLRRKTETISCSTILSPRRIWHILLQRLG
ncbi:hypothetical protein AXX17_AT3G35010 [Arabidopsis thaliana]|uniref:Uncharacterized protein n=1 Tax=Arabidopsis thaliana TaxID=3702 RepID=A0A178VG94_ARATH|nr:hypothetical protein AXX17_AT3G35010 [Arabidopsis thaliana]